MCHYVVLTKIMSVIFSVGFRIFWDCIFHPPHQFSLTICILHTMEYDQSVDFYLVCFPILDLCNLFMHVLYYNWIIRPVSVGYLQGICSNYAQYETTITQTEARKLILFLGRHYTCDNPAHFSCLTTGISHMGLCHHQWPLLLIWFNFNPSMDKQSHVQ